MDEEAGLTHLTMCEAANMGEAHAKRGEQTSPPSFLGPLHRAMWHLGYRHSIVEGTYGSFAGI